MGFFDFLKRKNNNTAKPAEQKKTVNSNAVQRASERTYDIICTSCFEKFHPSQVVFRATHTNEDVNEFFAPKIDTKLNNYRRRHNLEEMMEMEVVIDPNNDEHKNYISKYNWSKDGKVLLSITDISGEATKKRLCPHCHNDLPNTAGRKPVEVISVIGSTQVGKTVYMTSLLHTLENKTSKNFDASFMSIGTRYLDELRRHERTLFGQKNLFEATQKVDRIEPLALNFKYINDSGAPEPTLMFFDVAGEGMVDPDYIEKHAAHIKNSTGIIFLVDPKQIKKISARINLLKGEDEYEENIVEPKDIITKLYENFINEQEDGATHIPTAVVITKSDMLDALEGDYISKNSNILNNYEHIGYFNLEEYENINGEVKNFISEVDGAFKSDISAYFKNVSYFAVSALGSSPEGNKIERGVSPRRVDEPLLWILQQRGYIKGR